MSKAKRGRNTATTTAKTQQPVAASTESAKISGRAQRKVEEAESSKRRLWYIVGGIAAGVALIALVYFISSRDDGGSSFPDVIAANSIAIAEGVPIEGKTVGAADAPVILVEWGDYQ